MKKLSISLIFLVFFQICQAQNAVNEKAFIQHFEGAISGKYPIAMRLVNWANGSLVGDYKYKKIGKNISFYGEFTDINTFELSEYADNEMTGKFRGRFINENTISGTWMNPAGTKSLPFEVKAIHSTANAGGWAGSWHLNDVWDGGTLLIGSVTKDSLEFALSVVRSAHMGEIWGTAARSGNNAVFKKVEFALADEINPEPCYLIFELKGDYVQVQQESSTMSCGFGMRAYASGQFENKIREIKPMLSFGVGDDKIFPSQTVHEGFKNLVGEQAYELFAFNMQGYDRLEQSPEDGFSATAVQGAVYGLFLSNEAIIMYDNTSKYWAATIDFENNDPIVRYYTNDRTYKTKLPATIGQWRARFPDYPVRYESK